MIKCALQFEIFTILNSLQFSIKLTQIKCWFLERGENPEYPRKTSRSRVENQQTQPTYDAESGNRTRTHWWKASALTTTPTLRLLLTYITYIHNREFSNFEKPKTQSKCLALIGVMVNCFYKRPCFPSAHLIYQHAPFFRLYRCSLIPYETDCLLLRSYERWEPCNATKVSSQNPAPITMQNICKKFAFPDCYGKQLAVLVL